MNKSLTLKVKAEVTTEDWQKIQDVHINFPGLISAVRKQLAFVGSAISSSEVESECMLLLANALVKCRQEIKCETCNFCECQRFERKVESEMNSHFYRLKETKRKFGTTSYIEDTHEEDQIATYKKYHNHELYVEIDIETLIDGDRDEGREEKLRRIKKYMKKYLNDKEYEAWKLRLEGYTVEEIAQQLGYRQRQGISILLRRSLLKLQRFVAKEKATL